MKKQEVQLINRVYLYDKENKEALNLAHHEEIIDPLKVYNMLLSDFKFYKNISNSSYTIFSQYSHNFIKTNYISGSYIMTFNIDMFETILQVTCKKTMYDWIKKYANILFLVSNPVYTDTEGSYIIFSSKHVKCEYEKIISFDKIVADENYTIANGMILALSMNALGLWNDNDFLEVMYDLMNEKPGFTYSTITSEWQPYFIFNYRNICEHTFMYAFQHCNEKIYRHFYQLDPYDYGSIYIYNQSNIYVSNIYTSIIKPKMHQLYFLEEKKYHSILKTVFPYIYNNCLQYNINQWIKYIMTNPIMLKDFLNEGIIFKIIKHRIFSNKRIGLLKFFQTISYYSTIHIVSKRKLKMVWRKIITTFEKECSKYIWVYLIECLIFYKNNYKCNSLSLPPTKLIRDIMYLCQSNIKYYKNNYYSIVLYKNIIIPEYLYAIKSKKYNYTTYTFNISIYTILKELSFYNKDYNNIFIKTQKRHMLPLQCMYNKNFAMYQIMQKFYMKNPDELWKKI